MNRSFVIAGTDTDVGKTVFAAALAGALGASYWKPIQCGLEGGGDAETVRRLSGLPEEKILPEVYRLRMPASPHRAAEAEGVVIDVGRLRVGVRPIAEACPRHDEPDLMLGQRSMGSDPQGLTPATLVIEGAGGLMVPLTRKALQIDLFAAWRYPVILCARTALGTINHSLLSIAELRRRDIPVHGITFIGDANEDSERTICDFGGVRRLGRLPMIAPLDAKSLAAAFSASFHVEDFA